MEYLAWPIAALIFGLVGIFVFRSPLIRLLDRTKKVSKSGLETGEPQQLLAPAESSDALTTFMQTYDHPLLKEQEAAIRSDLQSRGLTDPVAAETALIRSLAGAQVQLYFERVQALIWASQVALLTWLNSRGSEPVSELQVFFEGGRTRDPEFYANYEFEAWLGYLLNANLVVANDGQFAITVGGREYLKWRVETGRAGPFRG